jgi:hypothetical protein
MAPPNNPAVAKISLVGNRDTREWVNTYHVYKTAGSMDGGDLHNLCIAFFNWYNTFVKPQLLPSIVLDIIEARKLDPSNPLAEDFTTGLPLVGSNAETTTNEAANVTLATSWRTGLAGRKYRGRNYFPAIREDAVTPDDRINTAMVTALTGIAAQYLLAIAGAGSFEPVVFHKFDNSVTAITQFVIDAILDSQRRRLPGRGR